MTARRRAGPGKGDSDPERKRRDGASPETPDAPDGRGSWADGLGDVRPLPGGKQRAHAPAPAPRPKRAAPARFHFPDPGEPGLGFASGISNAQRKQLQQGRIAPERRIDLHGLTRDAARRACLDALREAIAGGERCVLVVHGKGLHSAEGPVLRTSLSEWLADPSLEGRVLAFAPARPEDGGSGARYVLLRRQRSKG